VSAGLEVIGFDYEAVSSLYTPYAAGVLVNRSNATFLNSAFVNNTITPQPGVVLAGAGTDIAIQSLQEPLAPSSLWLSNVTFSKGGGSGTGGTAAAAPPPPARRLLQDAAAAPAPAPAPPVQLSPVMSDDTRVRPVFSDDKALKVFNVAASRVGDPRPPSAAAAMTWRPLSESDTWFTRAVQVRAWHTVAQKT
jgi:hypothetical protein